MKKSKDILFGLYSDEHELFSAIKAANTEHREIYDVFTPFPVHGLDPLLGIQESRLHIAGFVYGLIGCLFAFLSMSWIFTRDWPLIIGGKPHLPIPSFIPIVFELTVLFASIGMVVSYYLVNGQGPGVMNPVLHPRITDDKFCLAFDVTNLEHAKIDNIMAFLRGTEAEEIQIKTI